MRFGIISAGEGSRLATEGFGQPKPLVPIDGVPMIERLVRIFMDCGAERIAVIVNGKSLETVRLLKRLADAKPIDLVVKSIRAYLKDKGFEYQKNVRPDFYLLALAILSIIATALPYHSEFYTTFCFVAAIVYGLPIALYGYQACSKLVIMLIVQAVFFLGISLPLLLLVLEGNQTLIAYLIIFVPVIAFAFYQLIMHGYNKEEVKVIPNGSKNRKPSRR